MLSQPPEQIEIVLNVVGDSKEGFLEEVTSELRPKG